jgi:hypothetical protein
MEDAHRRTQAAGLFSWHGDDKRVAVYANRTRLGWGVGKQAMRLRAEIVERPFAHNLDRGGMRRTWLRRRENVHKRYLVHVAGPQSRHPDAADDRGRDAVRARLADRAVSIGTLAL